MIAELTDADLVARMRNFEDHFVERKSSGDKKDWLKTVIAFANSAPIGYPCVLYLGVRDNGEIEGGQGNLDTLQKTFNREMEKAYPRVPYFPKIINDDGRQALAVIVLGSELRPHFAGPSFVRRGSETFEASDEQFAELIAGRNSKTAAVLSYKDRNVTVVYRQALGNSLTAESTWGGSTVVLGCNQFWVTLRQDGNAPISFALGRVDLSFDDKNQCLRLEVLVTTH